MNYRRDIDGLRALAIILVMIFHGGLGLFPSGFIGVDIFFVISGFLITSIIKGDIEKGRFSLANFYIRRAWRIQPALLATVIITCLVAIFFYLPADFEETIKSAKYTLLLISNQFYSRVTTSYAAPNSETLLLLHTWSLSIEWQWYLILPIALSLSAKYLSQKSIKLCLVSGCVLFFILANILSYIYPDRNYYFFSSRAFEFMAGAALAYISTSYIDNKKTLANLLGILALAALLIMSTRSDILAGYPNAWSFAICLSACLLIYIGKRSHNIVSRLLSSAPLVFIGSISYSLYLWHWPVFSFAHYVGWLQEIPSRLLGIALSFVLALLSYYLIETPLRRKRYSLLKTLIILAIIPAIAFSLAYSLTQKAQGFPARMGQRYVDMERALTAYDPSARQACIDIGNIDQAEKTCRIGDRHGTRRALLIGDSHSNHFWYFFDKIGKDAKLAITPLATSSCLTLPEIYQYNWWKFKDRAYQQCHDDTAKYYSLIKQNKYDYVILGAVWDTYVSDSIINQVGDTRSLPLAKARIRHALEQALDTIVASRATPVIIKTIYPMPKDYAACFYRGIKLHDNNMVSQCDNAWADNESNWFSQQVDQLKAHYPSLIIIDPKAVQCRDGRCALDINGVPIYRDVGHITDYASAHLAQHYLATQGNPFLQVNPLTRRDP
ncbi:acyltransferase family protein [Edwardsiella tarda]|uniref:acyltransferase family protein n=1 Tax=Edwardsiella tarda TaxID=636 RepID=UPI0037C16CB1